VKRLFLILALFFSVFAANSPIFAAHSPVLGPNIEYGMLGMAAPAGLRGAFVPQFNANIGFSWFEPLGTDTYGTWQPNKTRYIRFLGGAELSPFYGTVRAGMGFAPLPYPFSILELRFIYANENLLFSDVEMAMKPKPNEGPPIQETWNAGYIFDSFYNRSSYSQIQSFNTQLGGTYFGSHFDISLFIQFTLIDITSDYEKKSFDYMRGIPLYSRDYVAKIDLDFRNHFNEKFAWDLGFFGIFSGNQIKGSYDKEQLSYCIISTGPLWMLNEGSSYISLNSGFFIRGKDGGFDDSIAERILLSVEYKHYWDFKFGKE